MKRIVNGKEVLGGVCLGIATENNWDVSLVRLIFILLFFVPFMPISIIYLIIWAIVPEEPNIS